MLESLLNPKKAERKPWEMFFVGSLYTVVSILIANWLFSGNSVFKEHVSIITVFLVVNFSIPFMFYTIRLEERKTTELRAERGILREHAHALAAFMWLFLGFVVAFSAFFVLFPDQVENNFKVQVETYCQINSYTEEQFSSCLTDSYTGKITTETGFILKEFKLIFLNNINVMLISILFSLFFGAGAIFILSWNASVIGAAVGILSQNVFHIPLGLLRFMIHGIPEILAYFVAGLSGGIIGVAVIRHHFAEDEFRKIIKDALVLFLIAIALLLLGAVIEVFVTPAIFA